MGDAVKPTPAQARVLRALAAGGHLCSYSESEVTVVLTTGRAYLTGKHFTVSPATFRSLKRRGWVDSGYWMSGITVAGQEAIR